MTKTFIALVLTTICSYGQFRPNSIGVVYLTGESSDTYHVTILFPIQNLEKSDYNLTGDFKKVIAKFDHDGEITLFDKTGDLLTIKQKAEFQIRFWCENDGGIQYRPTFDISIKKEKFKRKIKGMEEIQNIACFAIVNRTLDKVEKTDSNESSDIKLSGDYNNDGRIDCHLLTYTGEDCDGEPKNDFELILKIGTRQFNLRCCGP
jgi:hypothetical protein